jgi:GntR family transcriptional regulator
MSYATLTRPAYRRIADQLRRLIEQGEWEPGEQLPSANELAEQLDSTRTTVASAIEVLRREGLVYSRQGKGAFVRERAVLQYVDFSQGERRRGGPVIQPGTPDARTYRLLGVGPETAPMEVAIRFGIDEGERVLVRRFLMLDRDEPLDLIASYFFWEMVAGTRFADPDPTDTYDVLRDEFAVKLAYFIQDIRSRMPTPEEAAHLGLGPGDTVLHQTRTAYDVSDSPVNVTNSVAPGDRYVVRNRIPAHVFPHRSED